MNAREAILEAVKGKARVCEVYPPDYALLKAYRAANPVTNGDKRTVYALVPQEQDALDALGLLECAVVRADFPVEVPALWWRSFDAVVRQDADVRYLRDLASLLRDDRSVLVFTLWNGALPPIELLDRVRDVFDVVRIENFPDDHEFVVTCSKPRSNSKA